MSTSGFVSQVEESYVTRVTPAQEEYSPQKLYCYYLQTPRGSSLRIERTTCFGNWQQLAERLAYSSSDFDTFACEFEGITVVMG